MDERMVEFLRFITQHELEHYLTDEGKALIEMMRRQREIDRLEHFLDECEDMGMDRDLARSLFRKAE